MSVRDVLASEPRPEKSNAPKDPKADPFGAAKPKDETLALRMQKEKEIEERLAAR